MRQKSAEGATLQLTQKKFMNCLNKAAQAGGGGTSDASGGVASPFSPAFLWFLAPGLPLSLSLSLSLSLARSLARS